MSVIQIMLYFWFMYVCVVNSFELETANQNQSRTLSMLHIFGYIHWLANYNVNCMYTLPSANQLKRIKLLHS